MIDTRARRTRSTRVRRALVHILTLTLVPVLVVTAGSSSSPAAAAAALDDPAVTVAVGPTVTSSLQYEQSGWIPDDDVSCTNTGYLRLNSVGIYTVRDKLRCNFGGNFDYAEAVAIRAWGGDGQDCSFSGYYQPEDDVDLDLSLIPVNLHTSEPLDPDCNITRGAMVFYNNSWTCGSGFDNPLWIDTSDDGMCATEEVEFTWTLGALPEAPPPVVAGWSGSTGCGWASGDWTFVSCTATHFTVTLNSHAVGIVNEVQNMTTKYFRQVIELNSVPPTMVPVSPWRTGYPSGLDGSTVNAGFFDPPYSTPWVAPKSFTFPRPSAAEAHRDLTHWIYEIHELETIPSSSAKRTYRVARVGRLVIVKQGGYLEQPTVGDPGASEPPAPITETDPDNPVPEDQPEDGSCAGFSFTDPESWAGAGICILVKLMRGVLSALSSLAKAVGGIATAILEGLAELFIPSPSSWDIDGLMQQVEERPPGSLVTGAADAVGSTVDAYRDAGGGCTSLIDLSDESGDEVTCSQVKSIPGYSAGYTLVQVGIWGLIAMSIFNLLSRYFQETS